MKNVFQFIMQFLLLKQIVNIYINRFCEFRMKYMSEICDSSYLNSCKETFKTSNSTRKHTYAHKTLQKVIQIDKSNNKAHKITIKIANNSGFSLAFCLSCGSVVLGLMASRVNLHKRLEALARCYVTSDW